MTFRGTCPICNALVSFSSGTEIVCPHCENKLLVGSSDPTGHYLAEIDPDLGESRSGAFCIVLHPVGMTVCVGCEQIYPHTFECCPLLIDLALASLNANTAHGPNTRERIIDFLLRNPNAVINTVQLRAAQHQHGKLDRNIYATMRTALESLGMLGLLTDSETATDSGLANAFCLASAWASVRFGWAMLL